MAPGAEPLEGQPCQDQGAQDADEFALLNMVRAVFIAFHLPLNSSNGGQLGGDGLGMPGRNEPVVMADTAPVRSAR